MPDKPRQPMLPLLATLPQLAMLPKLKGLRVTRLCPKRLRSRAATLLVCFLVCTVLLPLGGCAVSVKPSGQVVTGISVGR